MESTRVLKGITRAKGYAAGEALVSPVRMGWAPHHVPNDSGKICVMGSPLIGQTVKDKIMVYPTVSGSTSGTTGLFYKTKVSKVGPRGLICQSVHYIDIAGAMASEIPAVDSLDGDPLQEIRTGDWVEIRADAVGQQATVTITRRG
jgi:predicted aconitase with swiveling domain